VERRHIRKGDGEPKNERVQVCGARIPILWDQCPSNRASVLKNSGNSLVEKSESVNTSLQKTTQSLSHRSTEI